MVAPPIEPVVVGVDGTLRSIGALDLAADEAMARVAPLVVVYTVEPPGDVHLPQHRWLLDLAVSRAVAEHPGLAVSGELLDATPVDALVAWSRRACLLVVGHTDGDPPSVAERVVNVAAVPVIVYRPYTARSRPDRRPVLVGVEIPGHGDALQFAFAEAELRGAPLIATYVWTGPPPAGTDGASAASPEDAGRLLGERLAPWSARYAEVTVRQRVVCGPAVGPVLAGASRDAALVVVGGHHTAVAGRAHAVRDATISHELIGEAGCPVAIVE